MLKKSSIRRIMISTIALVIVSILYFFPNNRQNEIKKSIEYALPQTSPIYLINDTSYVIRTNIIIKSEEIVDKAKELIEALTIGSEKQEYIPKNFKPVIPQNTKLLSISLNDGLLKLNFSKDFLNIAKNEEEKLIEALVFTLTEDENIKHIMIFIEGEKLEELPQTNIKLPNTLDRSFGINKIYDIDSIKDLEKTTIYYIGKNEDLIYYIPVTKVNNNKNNKVEVIIEELKSSPIYETNLMSYLASSVELLGYEALEDQISLSFNQAILSNIHDDEILEEVKYSIAYSIKDTLNIKEVIFKVNDKTITIFKEQKQT